MSRGVLSQHALTSPRADGAATILRRIAQKTKCVIRVTGNENFTADLKEIVETGPPVTDNRNSARRSLEEPDAWRISPLFHFLPGDVERESLGRVEFRMLMR
jgi:hypothetical protein